MKVVVMTCDKHRWLIPIFKYFYQKNWPHSPYETEVITEVLHVDGTTYYNADKSWASRLISYLKQSKEDKILLTLDDYMIKTKVDTAKVKSAEKLCEGNVGFVRLGNCPYKYFRKHTTGSPIVKGFREYPPFERFSMVVHIGFFQKQFLLDVLKDGESVWETEGNGSLRLRAFKPGWRILWPEVDIIDYTSNGGLIKKGRLRRQTLKWALSELSKPGETEDKLYNLIQKKKDEEARGR